MSSRGFTLVELMATLAIAGIVVVLGLWWYTNQAQAYKFSNALGQFRAAVNTTRLRAMNVRPTIYFASMAVAAPNFTFILSPDPDANQVAGDPNEGADVPALFPFFSSDVMAAAAAAGRYYIFLQGLMPADVTTGTGQAAANCRGFWSLNDRLFIVTAVTAGAAPHQVTCQPLPLPTLPPPLPAADQACLPANVALAQSSKGRIAATLQIVPVVTGAVIDQATGDRMTWGNYSMLRDRQTVIQLFLNTDRVQWQWLDEMGNPAAGILEIVFDSSGTPWRNRLYSCTLGRIVNAGPPPVVPLTVTIQVLPGGEVR